MAARTPHCRDKKEARGGGGEKWMVKFIMEVGPKNKNLARQRGAKGSGDVLGLGGSKRRPNVSGGETQKATYETIGSTVGDATENRCQGLW